MQRQGIWLHPHFSPGVMADKCFAIKKNLKSHRQFFILFETYFRMMNPAIQMTYFTNNVKYLPVSLPIRDALDFIC